MNAVCVCVYPEKYVQHRRVATDLIASARPVSLCGTRTQARLSLCAQQRDNVRKRHTNKSFSYLFCLEVFLLTGWVSFSPLSVCLVDLYLDVMMWQKKK